MIATYVELKGHNYLVLTDRTLEVDASYIQSWTVDREPATIRRADGRTFENIPFPAGTFKYQHREYVPDIDGWRYTGVVSTAGWYVIDPEMTQPSPMLEPLRTAGLEPDDGRGLFVPKLSAVAESFKRLFGKRGL